MLWVALHTWRAGGAAVPLRARREAEARALASAEVAGSVAFDTQVDALRTLFALKDRFTVLKLQQCPWGFGEEELYEAIVSKRAVELEFWRDLAYGL